MQEMQVQFQGWEDPLEKGMATHSSILTWEILWTEETGGLQKSPPQKSPLFWGLKRVRHDLVTKQQPIPWMN